MNTLPMNIPPANPSTIESARQLLEFLYSIRGKKTLSGQHNMIHNMSFNSEEVQRITGHYPAVWGGEWGFSDSRHNVDNIAYRPALLEEIQRQHVAGRIVVITYHQANPTIGEPCDLETGVFGKLTSDQWDDLFTEHSAIRLCWEAQVDRLAEAFLCLQNKQIPIIFRPYHEMNANWFWWGGNTVLFMALWNLIYDRFVNHHKINNLLWAWNPDEPRLGVADFYPGHSTVDLLGTDIFPDHDRPDTYPQEWYDQMISIAEGRPVALSENSRVPTSEDLDRMPWSYWMGWDRATFFDNTNSALKKIFLDERVISDSTKPHTPLPGVRQ